MGNPTPGRPQGTPPPEWQIVTPPPPEWSGPPPPPRVKAGSYYRCMDCNGRSSRSATEPVRPRGVRCSICASVNRAGRLPRLKVGLRIAAFAFVGFCVREMIRESPQASHQGAYATLVILWGLLGLLTCYMYFEAEAKRAVQQERRKLYAGQPGFFVVAKSYDDVGRDLFDRSG